MSTGKHLPRIVLAVAALASIATSQVLNEWFLDQRATVDPLALDDVDPLGTLAIQGVLRSQQSLLVLDGSMNVRLELRARDVTGVRAAEVVAVLTSDARSFDTHREVVSIPPGGIATVNLFLPAWRDCASELCTENYTVTLRRTALADDPIIDVTGTATIEVHGDDGEVPPPGTLLELDVTDIGPVP